MVYNLVAIVCLVWYIFIIIVCAIGVTTIRRNFTHEPASPVSTTRLRAQCPYLTVIRPVKGLEPYLYECLAATFLQGYPREKITIFFCVSDRDDPALPVLRCLIDDFSTFDARILIEDDDPNLSGRDGHEANLGPNPKIRNMSRAYREAKGDLVWIIDCNVWVGPDAAGRMVDKLCGFARQFQNASPRKARKYKFVHQLPLVVDLSDCPSPFTSQNHALEQPQPNRPPPASLFQKAGGLLEETFLSTAHAKFYTAINTVAVAPCIVGKSNMFRRSHLNALTSPCTTASSTVSVPLAQQQQPGIDYFSSNICEDHLIGDLLWKNPVPPSVLEFAAQEGHTSASAPPSPLSLAADVADPGSAHAIYTGTEKTWGNHALLPPHPTNLAVQPTAFLSLNSYLSRRTRWLRVRKFTVTLATLVEPGTESLLCCAYGAYAMTTLPWFAENLQIPQAWLAFWAVWLASVTVWCAVDMWVYSMLQATDSVEGQAAPFAKEKGKRRRIGWRWVVAWLGREFFAFPTWLWAVFGGVGVGWRGRRFRVGVDMRVREIIVDGRVGAAHLNVACNGNGKKSD